VDVLVVGSGGREHALAWKLAQSSSLGRLHAAPGNPGIARHGTCHPVRAEDAEGLLDLARSLQTDLVVVGPEAPLVEGVADELRHRGIAVFGPSRNAARIEGSKSYAKDVMRSAGVPTPATLAIARPPCVVKADGLAAGKGVFVCRDAQELDAALTAAGSFVGPLVIEELVEGAELSVFAICDGRDAVALPAARDFKRAFDGDEGANTGGMGSYAPVADLPVADVDELLDRIHRPVLAELARRGSPFVGLLFAGVIVTEAGPSVLEFNCRFGDPETQSILPLVDGDLLPVLAAAATGGIASAPALATAGGAAVTVVVAAGGYPESGDRGSAIAGIDAAEEAGALVFHAGTALHDGVVRTNGGRILNVTARGVSVAEARTRAYEAVELISFEGMRYRRDVALAAAGERPV